MRAEGGADGPCTMLAGAAESADHPRSGCVSGRSGAPGPPSSSAAMDLFGSAASTTSGSPRSLVAPTSRRRPCSTTSAPRKISSTRGWRTSGPACCVRWRPARSESPCSSVPQRSCWPTPGGGDRGATAATGRGGHPDDHRQPDAAGARATGLRRGCQGAGRGDRAGPDVPSPEDRVTAYALVGVHRVVVDDTRVQVLGRRVRVGAGGPYGGGRDPCLPPSRPGRRRLSSGLARWPGPAASSSTHVAATRDGTAGRVVLHCWLECPGDRRDHRLLRFGPSRVRRGDVSHPRGGA